MPSFLAHQARHRANRQKPGPRRHPCCNDSRRPFPIAAHQRTGRLSTGALPRFGGDRSRLARNPRTGYRPRYQLRFAGSTRKLYPPRWPHRTRRQARCRFHSIHARSAIRVVPVGAYAWHSDGEAVAGRRSARTQGSYSGDNGSRLVRADGPNDPASRRSPASANGELTASKYGFSRRRPRRYACCLAALFRCFFEQLTTRNCYNTLASETRRTVTPEGIGTTRVQLQRSVKSGYHDCDPYSVLSYPRYDVQVFAP